MSADPATSNFTKAVLISLLGVFLLDSMGAMVKHLSPEYPAQQLSVFRNLFGMVPSLLVLAFDADWRNSRRKFYMENWQLGLTRGLFVAFAQFCFYLSLVHLEFATAATLVFATPMVVTALSVPVLRHRVGIWRWSAVLMGFAGIILVMRPGSDVFTLYALLPLGAALGYGIAGVTVRLLPTSVPSPLVNLYSHTGALAGSLLLLATTTGYVEITSLADWFWIAAMGMSGGTGVLCLIVAYRLTHPSYLAPFDYTGILFSFLLGWIFFNEAPFGRLFPGVILIVGAGLLIIWRQRRLSLSH